MQELGRKDFLTILTKYLLQICRKLAAQSKGMQGIVESLYTNFADHGAAAQKGWQQFIEQAMLSTNSF